MPDSLHTTLQRFSVKLAFDDILQSTHSRTSIQLIRAARVKDGVVEPLAEVDLSHLFLRDRQIRAPYTEKVRSDGQGAVTEIRVLEAQSVGDQFSWNWLVHFRHDRLDRHFGVCDIAIVGKSPFPLYCGCERLDDRPRVQTTVA